MKKVIFTFVFTLLIFFIPSVCNAAEEEPPQVKWIEGPTIVPLEDTATLNIGEEYLFLDKDATVKMMNYFGNPSSDAELGSIYSKDQNQYWFIIFEYYESGHIKDDEKDKINPDDLLISFKKGTEQANIERKKMGVSELNVKGWIEKPTYNQELHSLTWSILAEDSDGIASVNYEARLLSREGYVSATLVCSEEEVESLKPVFNNIIKGFKFVPGKKYEDYIEGKDKLSELGLAALIVGGTAAVVQKGFLIGALLLLKKFAFLIVIAVIAFFSRIKARIFRKKKNNQYPDVILDPHYGSDSEDTFQERTRLETMLNLEEKKSNDHTED